MKQKIQSPNLLLQLVRSNLSTQSLILFSFLCCFGLIWPIVIEHKTISDMRYHTQEIERRVTAIASAQCTYLELHEEYGSHQDLIQAHFLFQDETGFWKRSGYKLEIDRFDQNQSFNIYLIPKDKQYKSQMNWFYLPGPVLMGEIYYEQGRRPTRKSKRHNRCKGRMRFIIPSSQFEKSWKSLTTKLQKTLSILSYTWKDQHRR